MYRANHFLTGNNDEIVPKTNTINWVFKAENLITSPVIADGTVYVSCIDHNLYAIDEIAGKLKWKFNTLFPIIREPIVYKNKVYVVAGDTIYCINSKTGELLWAMKEKVFQQFGIPVAKENKIYYGSRGKFYAKNADTGYTFWTNNKVSTYGASPIIWDNYIFTQSRDYSKNKYSIVAINKKNGNLFWEKEIEPDANLWTPIFFDNKIYIGSYNKIYCMDAFTGDTIWLNTIKTNIASSPVFANNKLFISSSLPEIFVITPQNGEIIDSFKNYGASFAIVGEKIFINNQKGELYSVDIETKKLNWKYTANEKEGGRPVSIANGRIYFSVNKSLYSISPGILPTSTYIASSKTSYFFGKILDKYSSKPIDGTITAFKRNDDGSIEKKVIKTTNGIFKLNFPLKPPFTIVAEAPGHFFNSKEVSNEKENIVLELEPIQKNKIFSVENIYFEFDSASLKPESIPILEKLVRILNNNLDINLEIRGHTDNIGDADYNLSLSLKRAERVMQYLVKNGITSNRIKTKGFGETCPIFSNETEEGRAKNRRTEFLIY